MSGVAALAFAAAFTSCSKSTDLYDGPKTEEPKTTNPTTNPEVVEAEIQAAYEAAFINTFGKPAADQDWGFGDDEAGTRAFTRASVSFNYYDFPADADESKFLKDVPEGVEKLTQNVGRANNYIDETWQGDLNIWGEATAEGNWQDRSGGVLYIKGNCDFSNRSFYFDGHSELYLIEGATLTLSANDATNLQTYTNIYMAAKSKIVTSGELKLNNGLHIFNHGTIEANKLSTNSDSWLVNSGTVTVSGKISVENDLSVIVNDGTLTAADLNTAGSGKFENTGDATISGTTFVNSNDNTWVNNGQYHTGNFIYNAASNEVINNCRLTVDDDFNINLGDNPGTGNFKMNSNSGVVTKNFNGGGNWAKNYSTGWSSFNGGPFYVYMGSSSVFKITGTATMNATKADYGFYGVGDSFAVLDANKIVAGAANQGYEVTYGGNLYVYAENGHFAQGYSGQYPYIDIKGNAKIFASGFEDGKAPVTITETNCNPGYEGEKKEITVLRIICEDLSASQGTDFDFNDVVFDVNFGDNATLTVYAAGGTLPLWVGTNGTTYNGAGNVEVHALYGKTDVNEDGLLPMINTGAPAIERYGFDDQGTRTVNLNISVKTRKEAGEKIHIWVEKNGVASELTAKKGQAAAKIGILPEFGYLSERVAIDTHYNGKFSKFVQGELSWDSWWK